MTKWKNHRPSIESSMIAATITLLMILAAFIFMPGLVRAATVNLVWTPVTESDLAGYRIYRADTYCSEAVAYQAVQTVGATTSASDVVGLGIYCYRITAFDRAGNESGPSNKIEIKTRRDLPVLGLAVQSVVP